MQTSTIFLIVALSALAAILAALGFARRATLLLTAKYLVKRRLAWVSLVAVALCVALVLIVLSVMGGWLQQFRNQFKTMTGDLIVSRNSASNFGHYEEMIAEIKKRQDVEAAIPLIRTAGLLAIPTGGGRQFTDFVGVVGVPPIAEADRVMNFSDSLWLQNDIKNYGGTIKRSPASFDLYPDVPYADLTPRDKQALKRPGMIVGAGAIGVKMDRVKGQPSWPGEMDWLNARLTVVPSAEELGPAASQINATTTAYWIVDGSRTQAPTHDANIYVPFDQLQRDLNLTAYQFEDAETNQKLTEPAKTTEIQIKLKPDTEPQASKREIQRVVNDIVRRHSGEPATQPEDEPAVLAGIEVLTWDEQPKQARFLAAVENEITIMMVLFGCISLVAVFMIFCIFYTIVTEKTRDIGILKSVGASAWNVAQIFLTYGAAIGLVGGLLGVILGWVFVRYINEIHGLIAKVTGREIYSSDIYAIDRLPNHVDPRFAIIIWVIGIFAAICGAIVPAYLAARKNPVEALRFE